MLSAHLHRSRNKRLGIGVAQRNTEEKKTHTISKRYRYIAFISFFSFLHWKSYYNLWLDAWVAQMTLRADYYFFHYYVTIAATAFLFLRRFFIPIGFYDMLFSVLLLLIISRHDCRPCNFIATTVIWRVLLLQAKETGERQRKVNSNTCAQHIWVFCLLRK